MRREPCGDVAATGRTASATTCDNLDVRWYVAFRPVHYAWLGRISFPYLQMSVPSKT